MEFVKIELRHDNHKVGINFWHMNWQTKYRYKMFAKFKYQSLCEASIRKASKKHNIKIHILRVMPDHLHTLVTLPKGMSDVKALQLLKGCSAYSISESKTNFLIFNQYKIINFSTTTLAQTDLLRKSYSIDYNPILRIGT